ncbi:MAG: uncharacterized protein A8A55_0259 [Amphiamblys sp. WSBS2006]|nr:MAG: uncharacterized protein A8A55_0259 [Amphiamblys sp. WSBS2006]
MKIVCVFGLVCSVLCDMFDDMSFVNLKRFCSARGKECKECKTREDFVIEARKLQEVPLEEIREIEQEEKKEREAVRGNRTEGEYQKFSGAIQVIQDIFASHEMMIISKRIKQYVIEARTDRTAAYEKLQQEYTRLEDYTVSMFENVYLMLPDFLVVPTEKDEKEILGGDTKDEDKKDGDKKDGDKKDEDKKDGDKKDEDKKDGDEKNGEDESVKEDL